MTKIYYDRRLESIERNSLEVEDIKNCQFRGFSEKAEKAFVAVVTDGYDTVSKIITVLASDEGTATIKVNAIPTNEGKIATELSKVFSKLDALEIIDGVAFATVFQEVLDTRFDYSSRLTETAMRDRAKRIAEAKKKEKEEA